MHCIGVQRARRPSILSARGLMTVVSIVSVVSVFSMTTFWCNSKM